MDLSVSPDMDAFWCYGVVAVLGAFVAIRQINQRLGEREGIWLFGRTWVLFAGYVIVPVALFWMLDRAGAINDTSLFGAVLVGVGYERIITGGNQSVRLSGDVSQFWTPFLAYADRIGARVAAQSDRRKARRVEQVVAAVVKEPQRLEALQDLASRFAADTATFKVQLGEIDASAATRGEAAALEEKTRFLYGIVFSAPDGHDLMREKGIIGAGMYWMQFRGLALATRVAAGLGIAGIMVIAGLLYFKPTLKEYLANYYIWRIGKTGTTHLDQFRARQNLFVLMDENDQSNIPNRRNAINRLGMLVRQPGLPMERVDLALQILLENRGTVAGNPELPKILVHSLRGTSVDARLRVNEALKFLAEYCREKVGQDLAEWKPNNGDSTAALEQKVKFWTQYWSKPCETPV